MLSGCHTADVEIGRIGMDCAGKVAVTGATGFVGRYAVGELLARGWRVRGLVRCLEKASRVLDAHEHLELIEGDIFHEGSLEALLTGCAAAVNTVGILRKGSGGQTFERVHVGSIRALLAAMRVARCERLIHISALGVSESAETDYTGTKFKGEQLVRGARSEWGLGWTIFRPGLIHGPEGEFMQMVVDWARGRIAPFVFMPYFARTTRMVPLPAFEPARVQPIFVGDLAWAIAERRDREQPVGEVYPLTGSETVTWPELLECVRDRVSLAKPGIKARGLPGGLCAMQARVAAAIGMGALLPFDEGIARMGMQDSTAQTIKAQEHLGFDPVGFRESVDGYMGSM